MKKMLIPIVYFIFIIPLVIACSNQSHTNVNKKVVNEKKYSYKDIYKAVNNGNYDEVKKIGKNIDLKDDIDKKDKKGNTLLNIAVHNDDIQISKYLIDQKANINIVNDISDSPYLYAGAEGKTEILAYMLNHSHPNEKVFNRYGGNALIPAAEKGHLDNVKLIIEKGNPNINHQNDFGYTALIEAVALSDGSKKYQDIVQYLVDNNAKTNLKDNNGKTALDYARELNYEKIEDILMNT